MDLLERLTIDELSEEQAMMAETIGLEAYRRLIRNYGGMNIYVPTERSVVTASRDKELKAAYLAGASIRELALKYGLSSVWVRQVIQSDPVTANAPLPGQVTMEDITKLSK